MIKSQAGMGARQHAGGKYGTKDQIVGKDTLHLLFVKIAANLDGAIWSKVRTVNFNLPYAGRNGPTSSGLQS